MTESITNVQFTAVDHNPFAGPEIRRVAPATEPQMEIWATCQLGGDNASRAFNESVSLRFTGPLVIPAFRQAWQALVQRHEAMHSAFSADGTQLCVFGDFLIEHTYHDYSDKTSAEQEQVIDAYVRQDALHVFDLINGPLVKIGLLKLADTIHHFTLTAHHLIGDGWSLGIMLQDLGRLYSAYVQQAVPQLEPAPTYSQYALEQQAFGQSDAYRQIETFWLNQFRDSVPVLDLPTDFTRPSLRTYAIARRDYPLSADLAQAVKKMGAKAGCSFVTTLLASFEVFLHRLTGQTDVVVGLPTAGQSATGYLGLVGHCVNLLPLRSFPRPDQSFLQFLSERNAAVLDAYEHQRLTFGSLLKKLQLIRDPARVPLVPVIFNVDVGLDDGVRFHGLDYQLISNPRQYGAVELFLNISGSAATASLVLEWSYNTRLFTESTIDRMMSEFERLLEAVVMNPSILLEDIPLADERDQVKKLARWNDTVADYPRTRSLPDLLAQTAAQHPNKTALIFTKSNAHWSTLTYRELDEKADQMAHAIRQRGLQTDQRSPVVGVVLDRSPELLVTLLAILKAGAAYVPIDPDYPHDRIAFMLQDSSASLLITSRKYHAGERTTYTASGQLTQPTTVLLLEDILAELDSYPKEAPSVTISGHNLAYVLYTSGSTGQPKGVLIEHRNLVNLLYSMISWPSITQEDVLLAITTVSFDIAGLELYLPLLVGATLVLADAETTKDGRSILETVETQKISYLQATPVTYKMMLAAGWEQRLPQQRLPLKILCCGEPLANHLAQKLIARCDTLWNMYGPTETTIYSTGKQILADDEIITIGRPIQNTQIYILDEHLNPLPEGSVGEIYIGGDGVARGYLNRPELTHEKFIANPFDPQKSATLYRTGDLGKFLVNGEIHCLGRIDQQVKIRGYRIELGEIEHALVTQPGIGEAVVIAREDRPGDQRLVAYLVTNPSLTDSAFWQQVPVWRTLLQDMLPGYMVPTDFVHLPQLPVTPNGKIDRKALPKPASAPAANAFEARPVTEMEKQIATTWKETLGLETIDIDTDFFELGGHSMIAVQVMTQLEKETGKRLPLSTLLTYPTVRKLAQLLQTETKSTTWKSLVPIKPQGTKMPFYIIHGIGLNLLNFNSMVSHLDSDQPVYGLQARGLDGVDEPLDDMSEIAAFYLTEVLEQNPDGPYAIGGYSFGGYVALEMARQLRAMGKEVKMLAMFDTNAQESDAKESGAKWLQKKIIRQFPKLVWFTKSLIQRPMPTLRYQQNYVEGQVERILKALGLRKDPPLEKGFDLLQTIIDKHEYAFENYTMKPYDGLVDLFKAQVRLYFVDDNKFLGWKKYALKGVKTHSVPGDHKQMLLPPNDKVFAQTLQRALDEASAKQ